MVNSKKAITEKKRDTRFLSGWHIVLFLTLMINSLLALPVTAIPMNNISENILRIGTSASNLTISSLLTHTVTKIPLNNISLNTTRIDTNSSNVTIMVRNIDSGVGISEARIYLDGGYEGMTSGNDGSLVLFLIPGIPHSIRVIKRGFMENITGVTFPVEHQAIVLLHPLKIIPIGKHGPVEERIDIVFVPSNTQYDCTKQKKILTDYYTSNEENFRNDANNLVQTFFLALDVKTSKYIGLPENYHELFNFYYYSDPGDFADAFNGCAGSLPEDFWDDAPFTDVAIIIYPKYVGFYNGPPCEPDGCGSGMGPGVKTWYKAPADLESIFIHEAGHAVFNLMDTYCGDTYYTQNNPYPNIWSNQSGCILSSENNQWDSTSCRQIAQPAKEGSAESCQKDFWRYDPEPDIMGDSSFWGKFGNAPIFWGKFGNASTLHIRHTLETINRWKL